MLGTAAAALRSTPFASALLKRERLQPSRRRPAQTAEAEDILKRSAGYVRLITPRKAETDKIDEESAPAQNVPDITPRHGLLKGEGPQDDGGSHRPAALRAHGGSVALIVGVLVQPPRRSIVRPRGHALLAINERCRGDRREMTDAGKLGSSSA